MTNFLRHLAQKITSFCTYTNHDSLFVMSGTVDAVNLRQSFADETGQCNSRMHHHEASLSFSVSIDVLKPSKGTHNDQGKTQVAFCLKICETKLDKPVTTVKASIYIVVLEIKVIGFFYQRSCSKSSHFWVSYVSETEITLRIHMLHGQTRQESIVSRNQLFSTINDKLTYICAVYQLVYH